MMGRLVFASVLCAGFALSATAGLAQDRPAPEGAPEIVVTGTRDMEGQVRDFVGALTVAPRNGQLTRFEAAICPTAVGVPAAQKELIADRIRKIARAADIAVGKAGCTPNVLLVVTPEKGAFIDALYKKHPDYFGALSIKDVRKLGAAPGPAAVWHVDGPQLNADGVAMPEGQDGGYVNRTTRTGSRMTAGARPQFAAAAVVVETRALDGLTTTQVADYAAMRTLARTDPSKLPGTAPTILKALETPMGEEVPITLTDWDLAFLRSLYQAPNNVSASTQRTSIRRGVEKQLEKRETAE
jgi:hypothetical protein